MSPELSGSEQAPLDVEVWRDGDTFYARPMVEMDLYSSIGFKQEILAALEEGGFNSIVVDLSHTGYIDSSFLGVMVGTLKRARSIDVRVALAGMNDRNIRKIFEIQGLDRIFPYADEAVTDNHDTIREWAQTHGARPMLKVYSQGGSEYPEFLFGNQQPNEYSREITWGEFFKRLGKKRMCYQPVPPKGIDNPYYEFFTS